MYSTEFNPMMAGSCHTELNKENVLCDAGTGTDSTSGPKTGSETQVTCPPEAINESKQGSYNAWNVWED